MSKASKSFDFKSLLHNTFVLYFILFISVAYLFFFMQTGNFRSVFVFLLVGFLTTFYSKNMIVVLVCALIGTRIISTMDNLHEGLETNVLHHHHQEWNLPLKQQSIQDLFWLGMPYFEPLLLIEQRWAYSQILFVDL